MLLKVAMPLNFSSPEYLSHHGTRKNRVSRVTRASPAHMNSPLEYRLHIELLCHCDLVSVINLSLKSSLRNSFVPVVHSL